VHPFTAQMAVAAVGEEVPETREVPVIPAARVPHKVTIACQ
jgi:hypothetical protein